MLIILAEHLIYAMSKDHQSVRQLAPFTEICLQTCDCFENQIELSSKVLHHFGYPHVNLTI